MGRKLLIIFLVFFLVLSLGAGGYLGYTLIQVQGERDALLEDIEALNKRVTLMQRKYAEEKARVGQLLRAKRALEGQRTVTQQDVESLQKEKETLVAEKEALKKRIARKNATIKAKDDRLQEMSQANKALRDKLDAANRKYSQTVNANQKEIAALKNEKQTLESELADESRERERCVSKNAKLAQISFELLDRYENKGAFESLLEKEPFTQIKKTELEDLVQEYQDEIDRQTLQNPEIIE
jgi:chromosome segregation ATPase